MSQAEELISAHSISVVARPAEGNPLMPQPADDLLHWHCTISADGVVSFDVHVSLHPDRGGFPPSSEEVLSLVIADVRAYRECNGYADFARLLGIDDGEEVPEVIAAWEGLGRISVSVAGLEALAAVPAASA